ncbi:heavy-metal-associated domain-containing protein [Geminocystis sp. CENA526]|uniref:heavy-metal-associated domain-containing protein n=1 Tax=Geminocystis sp. CENA526 TaxID=1355871 RepID=UPI003D6F9E17
MTITFNVPSIACDVCANTITKAIQNYDPSSIVRIDVSSKVVEIDTNKTSEEMKQVITDVGHEISN